MILVKTNGSIEGNYIKQQLEDENFTEQIKNNYTIRWGEVLDDNADEGIIFNTRNAIINTLDKENVILMLRKNHINAPRIIKPGKKTDFPIMGRNYEHQLGMDIKVYDSIDECLKEKSDYYVRFIKFTKEYKVHIIDQEIFYIEEKYKDHDEYNDPIIRTEAFGYKTRPISLDNFPTRDKNEIETIVKKSIHSMGLDFGVVSIGKTKTKEYYAIDVDCEARNCLDECLDDYVENFKKLILKYEELKKRTEEITIGADPECLLKDKITEKLIVASYLIKEEYGVGLDARSLEAGKNYYPLVEIRPGHSTNPEEVYNNVKELLNYLHQYIDYKNIGLYGGSTPVYNYWVGGHIHFGLKPNSKLIRALDNYLAIPIMMIQKTSTARQRNKKYGMLGNCRLKEHGGFEYCSVCSWLISPKITLGVLSLAKIIAEEFLNLTETFINDYSDVRAYYLIKKEHFRDKVKKIMKSIRASETYQTYGENVEYIFDMIENRKEWDEDQDIKDAWGFTSSDEEYNISETCYIPKKRREALGINIGQIIKLRVGRNKYELKVYPKDDSSSSHEGFINFSKDIHEDIGLNMNDELAIYKTEEYNRYKAGPVFGIICDEDENEYGPYASQTSMFKKLIKLAKIKGCLAYVFSIDKIYWDDLVVLGKTFNYESNEWYEEYFPIPDVVYDRGLNILEYFYGRKATEFHKNVKKYSIKFINSPSAIDLISNKWETHKFLSAFTSTKIYLPETYEYNYTTLMYMLNKYDTVYLKLKDGQRALGIFCITRAENNNYEITHKKLDGTNKRVLVYKEFVLDEIKKIVDKQGLNIKNYIIQQGIDFQTNNDLLYELRILMVKNGLGKWMRTAIVGRVRRYDREFINLWDIEERYSELIKESVGSKEEFVKEKINQLAKRVTRTLDENSIELGEVAIDIGIDKNLNLYIIELNSKPHNLLALIGAYKRRNVVLGRIVDYARYLMEH